MAARTTWQINGTGTHFWLKEGELTPLLTTGDVILSGKTFNNKETGHQWFAEFAVSKQGKRVVDVALDDGKPMIMLDGEPVRNHVDGQEATKKARSAPDLYPLIAHAIDACVALSPQLAAQGVEVSLPTQAKLEEKGHNFLDVKAGGVTVNIYPTVAKKFSSEENQTKYEHLNVEFSQGISQDAKGIFAELAGVRKMSEATAELLRQPPKAERGPKA